MLVNTTTRKTNFHTPDPNVFGQWNGEKSWLPYYAWGLQIPSGVGSVENWNQKKLVSKSNSLKHQTLVSIIDIKLMRSHPAVLWSLG